MEDNFENRIRDIRARIAALRASLEIRNGSFETTQTRSSSGSKTAEMAQQRSRMEPVEKRNKELEDIKSKLRPKNQ